MEMSLAQRTHRKVAITEGLPATTLHVERRTKSVCRSVREKDERRRLGQDEERNEAGTSAAADAGGMLDVDVISPECCYKQFTVITTNAAARRRSPRTSAEPKHLDRADRGVGPPDWSHYSLVFIPASTRH